MSLRDTRAVVFLGGVLVWASRTFDQLAAVCGAAVDLQGHNVALCLVEELDGDADRRGHGRDYWFSCSGEEG